MHRPYIINACKVGLQCPMESGVQVVFPALKTPLSSHTPTSSREAHLNNISPQPTKPSGLGGPTDAST